MIGSLRGELCDREADEILVEVAGVGYRVTVTPSTAVTLGDVGDEVRVHVHHHIREDAQTLYGFASRHERVCFEALIGAHGVGPSLAMAILSVHDPAALARAVADADLAALCLVPGVGKKTAERLLVELKSRLDVPDAPSPVTTSSDAPGALTEVREALVGLGYRDDEIQAVVADLPSEGDVSLLLKQALRALAVSA